MSAANPEFPGVSGSIAGETGANAGNSLAVDGGTPSIIPEDRELFIFLLGFDAVEDEGSFHRIRAGEFDRWKKMKAIAAHRHKFEKRAIAKARGAS